MYIIFLNRIKWPHCSHARTLTGTEIYRLKTRCKDSRSSRSLLTRDTPLWITFMCNVSTFFLISFFLYFPLVFLSSFSFSTYSVFFLWLFRLFVCLFDFFLFWEIKWKHYRSPRLEIDTFLRWEPSINHQGYCCIWFRWTIDQCPHSVQLNRVVFWVIFQAFDFVFFLMTF